MFFYWNVKKDMKREFNFVNIAGSLFVNVTDNILAQ